MGMSDEDAFHTLLGWEAERPELGVVHHLLVLCFHLQHPSRYSPEALAWAREALVDFLERGVTPRDIRRRDRGKLSSTNRGWRVRGTPGSHGVYERPMHWTMSAQDVVSGGIDRYVESVDAWARSILATLREAEGQRAW